MNSRFIYCRKSKQNGVPLGEPYRAVVGTPPCSTARDYWGRPAMCDLSPILWLYGYSPIRKGLEISPFGSIVLAESNY